LAKLINEKVVFSADNYAKNNKIVDLNTRYLELNQMYKQQMKE